MSGPKKEEQRERVLWASFETGDVNDPTMEHLAPPSGGSCGQLPLLLTLGFANGFSVWIISVSFSVHVCMAPASSLNYSVFIMQCVI